MSGKASRKRLLVSDGTNLFSLQREGCRRWAIYKFKPDMEQHGPWPYWGGDDFVSLRRGPPFDGVKLNARLYFDWRTSVGGVADTIPHRRRPYRWYEWIPVYAGHYYDLAELGIKLDDAP